MAFQILMFFVFTYQPSALEGQLEMALPATGTAPVPKDQKPDLTSSPDTEIDLPSEITVIVRTQQDVNTDGTISQVAVQEKAGEKEVRLDALNGYLAKMRPSLLNQNDVKLKADGRLKYEYVMEVMDICRRAGFSNVGFDAPPDLARIAP
jgi:biopolymer transport protein ExbD